MCVGMWFPKKVQCRRRCGPSRQSDRISPQLGTRTLHHFRPCLLQNRAEKRMLLRVSADMAAASSALRHPFAAHILHGKGRRTAKHAGLFFLYGPAPAGGPESYFIFGSSPTPSAPASGAGGMPSFIILSTSDSGLGGTGSFGISLRPPICSAMSICCESAS